MRGVMWLNWGLLCFVVLASIGLASCKSREPSRSSIVDQSRNRVIEYSIWAPSCGRPAPLVLISHGAGGHYSDHTWLVKPLLKAGFIVAALNHPHDTRRDSSRAGLVRVWDRPADVSFLLLHLIRDAEWSKCIDARRVAVAGFSSGGYTAIALAGAIFDPALMDSYCERENRRPDCELGRGVLVDRTNATLNFRDDRIKAVVAMAPAVGPGVTEESLNGINIPVLVIAAADDELVSPDSGARRYANLIRGSELIVLPAGGHFVFLECGPVTALVDLFVDYNLCGRGIDVDRTQVQRRVSDATIKFLVQALSASGKATSQVAPPAA